MYKIENFFNNQNIKVLERDGSFAVVEYQVDKSVYSPGEAIGAYYAAQMNVKRRQVVAQLKGNGVTTQAGAMQWMLGDLSMVPGVKGVGGLLGGAIKGRVTGEAAAKPQYTGNGILALEPTFRFILVEDVGNWGSGLVVEDGMFLCCDSSVKHEVVARGTVSAALAGGEGLFNLCMTGSGLVCLESRYPREELIEVTLDNDVIKVDGPLAVAWSKSLQFTVERSAKSLVGSAVSGEGLVNVYRGTGKVLMAPVNS